MNILVDFLVEQSIIILIRYRIIRLRRIKIEVN